MGAGPCGLAGQGTTLRGRGGGDKVSDVRPTQVVDPDHAGADEEQDGNHVTDLPVRDHVADFLGGVPA